MQAVPQPNLRHHVCVLFESQAVGSSLVTIIRASQELSCRPYHVVLIN